jgi:hypothetical protein
MPNLPIVTPRNTREVDYDAISRALNCCNQLERLKSLKRTGLLHGPNFSGFTLTIARMAQLSRASRRLG